MSYKSIVCLVILVLSGLPSRILSCTELSLAFVCFSFFFFVFFSGYVC